MAEILDFLEKRVTKIEGEYGNMLEVAEYTPEETADKYYVWDILNHHKDTPSVQASTTLNHWFYTVDETAPAPFHLKSYTLVSWDGIRYFLNNSRNRWIGKVKVLDKNKDYARQPDDPDASRDYSGGWSKVEDIPDLDPLKHHLLDAGTAPLQTPDAKILKTIGKPTREAEYWVDLSKILTVGPSDFQEANSFTVKDVILNGPADLQALPSTKDWRNSPDNTLYEDTLYYYIHINSYKNKIPHEKLEELKNIRRQCIINAIAVLAESQQRNIPLSKAEKIADYLMKHQATEVITEFAQNRPNSFYKVLVRIPKAYIDPYEIVPKSESTHVGIFRSWDNLEESYKKVIEYFEKLDPLVKSNTVRLDMQQEMKFLKSAWTNLLSIKKTPLYSEVTGDYPGAPGLGPSALPGEIEGDDIIKLGFDRRNSFAMDQMNVVRQAKESGVVSVTQKLVRGIVDLNKTGVRDNDVFKRSRTMLYLMNLDLMAQDIQNDVYGGKNKWIDFLFKYTYKMPDFQPSNTTFDQINFQNNEVTSFLKKIDRELDGPKTLFSNNKIMREIGPDVRGLLADTKKSLYSKIEDPTLQKIFQTIDGINSLESLYTDVLNKAPIDKLLEMGRQIVNPVAQQQMFIKKSSQLKSQARLAEGRLQDARGKKPLRKITVKTPTEKSITNLTGQQPEMIMKAIEELFIESFCNNLRQIIKTIRRLAFSPDTVQQTKDFGELKIENTVKENQDEIIKNILNSLPEGKGLDMFDVKKILLIISENCTSKEIVALAEGEAQLSILEILGYLIGYEFPILAARLDSVYDVEEFLVLLLRPLRSQLIEAAAQIEFAKKEEEKQATYCAPDYKESTNHLLDRFPPDLAAAALDGEKESRENFLSLLNELDSALDKDMNKFIFGDKLDAILDRIMTEDESSSYLTNMVIESFFSPFIRNFSIEGLNISTFYLEPQLVDKDPADNFSRVVSPPEITSRIGEMIAQRDALTLERDSLDKDDHKAKRKKLLEQINDINSFLEQSTKSKKVVLGLKNRIEFLKQALAEGVGTWQRTSVNPVTYILKIPLTEEDKAGTSSFIKLKIYPMEEVYQIDPNVPLAYDSTWKTPGNLQEKDSVMIELEAVIADEVVINNRSTVNTKEMSIYDFISNEDIGYTIQASAFSNIIKEQIKDYFPDYIWTERLSEQELADVGNTQRLQQLINDFKSYLFDLLNQQLLKRVSKEASRSSFFKESVLSQLRIATLPGDESASPPPICGEEFSEESVPPSDRTLFPDLFDLEELVESIKLRKTYFDVLSSSGASPVLTNRSSLDNAIIFEALELFLELTCLEFLMSGIFIYGEASLETVLKEKNNFKILQDTLDFSLQSLGDDFESVFYELLQEYAALRQSNPFPTDVMPPMPIFLNSPDPDTSDIINSVTRFCLAEALENIFPLFQRIVQTFSASDKLSSNELLDLVPTMDVASQTITNNIRFDLNNASIREVHTYGGIIVEKYIKAIYTPPVGLEDKSWYHPAHSALYKMLITDPQAPSSYVQSPSGEWTQEEGTAATAAKTVAVESWLETKITETDVTRKPWQSLEAAQAEQLESWMDLYTEEGLVGIENLNLPGYKEFVVELNAFDYSALQNNEFYPVGTKTGVVNLNDFASLQKEINDYNEPFIAATQDKLQLLNDALSFKNNYSALEQTREEQLSELESLGSELDKYLLDYLNTFRDDATNSGKEYIVQNGTFQFDASKTPIDDPKIFSDKIIFEWVSGNSPYYHDLTRIIGGGSIQKNAEEWWGLEYPGYELAQKYWLAVLAMTGLQQSAYLVEGAFQGSKHFQEAMEKYLKGDKWTAENSPFLLGFVKRLQQFFFLNPIFGKMISTLIGGSYYYDYTGFQATSASGDLFHEEGILGGMDSLIQVSGNQGTEAYTDDLSQGGAAEMTSSSTSYYEGLVEYYENRVDHIWRHWKEALQGILNPPEAALEKFNYWDTQKQITEKRIEWFEKNLEGMKSAYEQFLSKQQEILKTTQEITSLLSEARVNFDQDIDDSSRSHEQYTDTPQWFKTNEFIRQFLYNKAKKEQDNNVIIGDYKKYFGALKYGVRVSYIFPNFENVPILPFGLHKKLTSILPNPADDKARLTGIKDNLNKLFRDPPHSRNIFHKAFKLEEKLLTDNGIQTTKINLLPIVTYEEDVENFTEKQVDTLSIENMAISDKDSFPFKDLKTSLMETPGYEGIFGECMYYGDLLGCLGLYSSLVTLKGFYNASASGMFSGAKINLKNIIDAVKEKKDFRAISADLSPLDKMKNNFLSLSNAAGNPRPEGSNPPDKVGYAAVFAAKTALKILKGVVETTDPAIIQGKKIQSALVGAVKASKDISETLANVTGNEIPSNNSDSFSQAEKTLVNDAMLGPVVFIGVRPFPPIPFPVGNPVFPLTAAGATYLALTTAMSLGEGLGDKKSTAEKDEAYCVEE